MLYTVQLLSIRTERTDKQWRHWSDCSLRSSLIRVFTVCHSIYFIYTMILQGKPKLFSFRIFSILFSGVPILRGFHLKKCLLIAFECRKCLLWAVTVRIMFLLDQAGNLKIRWNLVLYARLYWGHKSDFSDNNPNVRKATVRTRGSIYTWSRQSTATMVILHIGTGAPIRVSNFGIQPMFCLLNIRQKDNSSFQSKDKLFKHIGGRQKSLLALFSHICT